MMRRHFADIATFYAATPDDAAMAATYCFFATLRAMLLRPLYAITRYAMSAASSASIDIGF